MRSRKIFRIYASLAEEERKAFGLYLTSPYLNANQRLADFRQVLEDRLIQQPDYDPEAPEIWKLLPDVSTEFRANGFDKLCAELLSALNDFLALQHFRSHAATVASHQLAAYTVRNLDEWIPGMYESLTEKLGSSLDSDNESLYAHLQMTHDLGIHLFRVNRRPPADHLLKIDEKLNAFYFAKKLDLAGAVDTFNKGYGTRLELPYTALLKDVFENNKQAFPDLVLAKAAGWLLLREQDATHFHLLKSLLEKNHDSFPGNETDSLYTIALNFCIARLNAEEEGYEEELDAIHLKILERGNLLINGRLSPAFFKNIVQVRLRLGHLDWVERFMEEWGSRLSDDGEGSALRYNKAVLAFYAREFAGCLREMENVMRDFKSDLHYGSDARIYALMSVFELNKSEDRGEEFDARLNAFRLYLIRDTQMGEIKKQRQLNIIKQFRKLRSLQSEPEATRKAKVPKILKGLENLKPASNRKWFEKQVSDLLD
jgi:hypothetical protein